MSETILHIDTIISDPAIRNGSPIVSGTTLRVMDIVLAHTSGDMLTPEQLALNFRLSLGEIYATLSYYHLHKADIDAEIKHHAERAKTLVAELEAQGKLTRLE